MTTAGGIAPAPAERPTAGAAATRAEIDRLIAAGDAPAVAAALRALWLAEPGPATASFVVTRSERLLPSLGLQTYRVAVLRSFTVEPIVPLLRASAFVSGLDLRVRLAEFNAYAQEILDPASPLYTSATDAVILAIQTRDLAPAVWRDVSALDGDAIVSTMARAASDMRGWIDTLRARSHAHLIVHNFEQPVAPSCGVLDAQAADGQSEAIRRLNAELRAAAASHRGVYVLDYDALVARHGRAQWHDERKWLSVRLPIAAGHLNHMAAEWLRFLLPLAGRTAKVLAVDLDNTLWGGIVGEDGVDGLALGTEYPGAAFQDVQRALLDVRRRGVVLAICSKNNPDDALDALRRHPGMLLKPEDFSAVRINWNEKAQNLREIAAELNVGLDAVAFVDDNPIERQHVRAALPDVHVIELPSDPMQFARTVRESPLFERLGLSAEDRQRAALYDSQRGRDQLMLSAASREDFYRSLEQVAEIAPLTAATLTRIVQLTNKTNQFNLTTRRYTEQQLRELVESGTCECHSIRVRDRFGDNGLVGVAITRTNDGTCEIDALLLSCRVIGRTIETAFLSFLAERARQAGAASIQGWFLPTKKNAPAKDFYSSHGFSPVQQSDGGTLWRLDLAGSALRCPAWVRVDRVKESDR